MKDNFNKVSKSNDMKSDHGVTFDKPDVSKGDVDEKISKKYDNIIHNAYDSDRDDYSMINEAKRDESSNYNDGLRKDGGKATYEEGYVNDGNCNDIQINIPNGMASIKVCHFITCSK